ARPVDEDVQSQLAIGRLRDDSLPRPRLAVSRVRRVQLQRLARLVVRQQDRLRLGLEERHLEGPRRRLLEINLRLQPARVRLPYRQRLIPDRLPPQLLPRP